MFRARNTYILTGFLQGKRKGVSEECKLHTSDVLRSICLKKGPKPKQYNTECVSRAASETALVQQVTLGEWSGDKV